MIKSIIKSFESYTLPIKGNSTFSTIDYGWQGE